MELLYKIYENNIGVMNVVITVWNIRQ